MNEPWIPEDSLDKGIAQRLRDALKALVADVPLSEEVARSNPVDARARAAVLADKAAMKAALIGGGMAVVPGPFGVLTIIPALVKIWQIQRQLVADIAACYGKTPQLSSAIMLYCLFRHGSATIFKETVVQVGGRLLVREGSLRAVQQLIQRISVNVTQRMIGQFFSRWLPLAGSAAIAAFTYWDTKKIAKTAVKSFESEIGTQGPRRIEGAV